MHRYTDGTLSLFHGPIKLAEYDCKGQLKGKEKRREDRRKEDGKEKAAESKSGQIYLLTTPLISVLITVFL